MVQGRHQRAETGGLISFIICAAVGAISMNVYLAYAPAIWQLMLRRFIVCSGIGAACAVVSFLIGYLSQSRSMNLKHGWLVMVRRLIESLALSAVYAATTFLTSFALLSVVNEVMGPKIFVGYMSAICGAVSGVVGYMTFVQARMMNAKTLASLLPFFVISGVCVAGLTTDDPYWYHNNFSQLGDRTTFAATMFNSTLMLGGLCIIIISYFAISELVTTERLTRLRGDGSGTVSGEVPGRTAGKSGKTGKDGKRSGKAFRNTSRDGDPNHGFLIPHYRLRTGILSVMLTLSGVAFIGIGAFRYTPHPILHNVFARGLPVLMLILFLLLPWIAPRLSRTVMVISDLMLVVCAAFGVDWLMGNIALTDVEALACMVYLGWFIVFSRQIAALEADRIALQVTQTQIRPETSEQVRRLESRIASDR
ncbi:ABC transporter permease [Bifidobacterium pongonis]|uniref:ABC transporter permease n=1 Tax=Bifidobacterium pongonis TaxID=2834432 RepID=UPI001F4147EF|nr:ABC transporter permease [Bifidobacterium pongonis]